MELTTFLNAFTGFFVIIDPIGTALIFHALLPEGDKRHRVIMAVKATLISAVLLLVFGNFGEAFLNSLGININALRISGGLLLFFTAFNLITREVKMTQSEGKQDISVYPLSIPLLAGPGALTLSILLFSGAETAAQEISVLAAVIITYGLTLVLMLLSGYVKRVIGKTGDEILRRFLGVILAALAIQFIYDGFNNMLSL
ncbi:MarC family protein [Nitrincola sp.]|uniref:MarC family protein n=1 Tax=Nitrincola sp. TaxID=1926584 RepID=UPI003A95C7E5